jgi:hypothetical protein
VKLDLLKSKIKRRLQTESIEPQSVPELCKELKEDNEYNMLIALSELEDAGDIMLNGFDRIYREDGGAIYLAKYSKKMPA